MMKTRAIEPARLQAVQHGDPHASGSAAWSEARALFIEGCELPARIAHLPCLRVLETGFGSGVNFLATWAWFRQSAKDSPDTHRRRLHYVSIEKHPFTREDLQTVLKQSLAGAPAEFASSLNVSAARLLQAWPPLIPGCHSLVLDDDTTLTLAFGDIAHMLPAIHGKFDAFYLGGLASDGNPAMWPDALLSQLGKLAAPAACLSGRRVADAVSRALAASGFDVSTANGSERDSFFARWPGTQQIVQTAHPVIVIGAGIAGASVARQLASRGLPVTVVERDHPASGASGNPVAVVRPEPGSADNPIAEFSVAGVTWLKSWLALHGSTVPHAFCGALRITRDRRRHDKMAAYAQTVPDAWLREVDREQGTALCGQAIADDAFFLREAGWVQAAPLVMAMLDHPLITVQTSAQVTQLSPLPAAGWELTLSDGKILQADTVVLANAFGELSPVALPLDRARGQLSTLAAREGRDLQVIVCRDGYITPAVNGTHTIGATIQYDDADGSARAADDAENFARLQRLLPGFAQEASELQSGRVSWRSTTQDRLPLVGKLAEGLYASLGHGSRGIACGPLCAEFLAALMRDEPLPLGREWIDRLSPLRFL